MPEPKRIPTPAPDKRATIERPDGRRVGWSEWGSPDGTPLLFVTGAAMSSVLGFGHAVLAELRVRLVCVDRAGLGMSEADPDKSLRSYAEDVRAVLAHEGIERPPAVGFSQGAPFALALAAHGVVSRVALVSGQDELAHPTTKALLPEEVARMVDDIARDTDAFEVAFASRVDAHGMWSLVVGMSAPHDRALYESPAFADAYRAALAEAFAEGPSGYLRDLTLAMRPWPFALEELELPVHLWYGRLDASPVHSPDHGAILEKRLPNATRHVVEDEGSSLLWTRAREVLESALTPRPR